MSTPAIDHVERVLTEAGCRPERDLSLARFTTYRLGGPAALFLDVADVAQLESVRLALREAPLPVLVVGRGSNLLVAERGFEGLALRLSGSFEDLDVEDGVVTAGAAVALPALARRAAAEGWSGLEFYVGIPGSVGGAVRMNAGGHGRETVEVLRDAWVFSLDGAAPAERRPVHALELGYRTSNLGPRDLVVRAAFSVEADDPGRCEARVAEVVRWRREHQPGGSNAGSVFRNPPGDSAGRLIDACGLKGTRVGGAVVSEKHANFFQAERGASADDVRRLVLEIQARVADATGIVLEPELRMVGFEDEAR